MPSLVPVPASDGLYDVSRKVFYDPRRAATFPDWKQWAQDQEARIEDFARRVRDLVLQTLAYATVSEKVVSNSTAGARVVIDFRLAQKYVLILHASVGEIVFIPPDIADGRACSTQLEIVQAGSGTNLITTWTGVTAFFGSSTSFYSSGLPILSTAVGYVDVIAFTFSASRRTFRGMFTPGAPA